MIELLDHTASTIEIVIAGLTAISLLVGYLVRIIYRENDK